MDNLKQTAGASVGESEKKEKGECLMCKFVLIFSFIALLLTIVFVFFSRIAPGLDLVPAQSEDTSVPNVNAIHERVLELQKQPATTSVAK